MNSPSETLDPMSVERKIFVSFWDDGLVDIAVGLGLVLIGIFWIVDLVALTVLAPVALLPLWLAARNRIAIPRTGFVRFAPARKERTHRASVVTSIVGYGLLMAFGALYVYLVKSESDVAWIEPVLVAIPTLVIAAVLLLSRFVFDMPIRTVAYALVTAAFALVGVALEIDPGGQFVSVGLVLLMSGVVLLARFLNAHPLADVPEMQVNDA